MPQYFFVKYISLQTVSRAAHDNPFSAIGLHSTERQAHNPCVRTHFPPYEQTNTHNATNKPDTALMELVRIWYEIILCKTGRVWQRIITIICDACERVLRVRHALSVLCAANDITGGARFYCYLNDPLLK